MLAVPPNVERTPLGPTFFGGAGEQAAVVWHRGEVVLGPLAQDFPAAVPVASVAPINAALTELGVRRWTAGMSSTPWDWDATATLRTGRRADPDPVVRAGRDGTCRWGDGRGQLDRQVGRERICVEAQPLASGVLFAVLAVVAVLVDVDGLARDAGVSGGCVCRWPGQREDPLRAVVHGEAGVVQGRSQVGQV